ncbi:MAG: fasciclin domain-containing protein [Flavobacterium sp.]
MKSYFKFRKISIIVLLALITIACSKSKDEPETNNTITDIASRKSDLKIFTQALNITGFADLYKQSGAHTIFAPSNDAFTTFLTAKGFATINDIPVDQLKNLLLNHIINGSFQTTQLTTKYVKSLAFGSASATNELSLYVDTTAGIKVNGVATVVTSNIVASNGVIHIVDTVIDLPTIATHTSANLNLSSFANTLALPAQSAVLSNITGSTIFTVFEPTNDAFTSLDTELASAGGIAGVSDTNMSKILSYHITNGNTLSTAFSDGLVFSTLTVPQSFTLQVTGGTKITDSNNRIANVTYTNVQCNNGVIHIIDKVLLPNL